MLTIRTNGQLYAEVAGFEDMILYNDYLQIYDIELLTIEPSKAANSPLCIHCNSEMVADMDGELHCDNDKCVANNYLPSNMKPNEIIAKVEKILIKHDTGIDCISATYNIQGTVDIELSENIYWKSQQELEDDIRKTIPNVNNIYYQSVI